MSERVIARRRRERIGFVFQSYNVLSKRRSSRTCCCRTGWARRLAMTMPDTLWHVGLLGTEHRPVGELSGGQRQRGGGAELSSPGQRSSIAGEPTGALDATTGHHVLELRRFAVDDWGITVVVVTHVQRTVTRTTTVERVSHRAPLSDRRIGHRARRADSLQVLTPADVSRPPRSTGRLA
jgi:putative ABC transport system ATP-binding protein